MGDSLYIGIFYGSENEYIVIIRYIADIFFRRNVE